MPYESPAALRVALEARLLNESNNKGVDLQRLRRRAVFERLLVRLDAARPGLWVVKGGIALEVRMQERARATRDLDLAIRTDEMEGDDLREIMIEAVTVDPEGDGFTFEIGPAQLITADMGGRPGWRFSVRSALAGKEFVNFRLDVVARSDEASNTERIALPGVLSFAGFPDHEIEVVARAQHFAEKLHALTRTYGDRPSSRVRDLADLVLFVEEGFHDLAEVREAVGTVFELRATHPVPTEIADPPESWSPIYQGLAKELDVKAKTIDEAMTVVRGFWKQLLDLSAHQGE